MSRCLRILKQRPLKAAVRSLLPSNELDDRSYVNCRRSFLSFPLPRPLRNRTCIRAIKGKHVGTLRM